MNEEFEQWLTDREGYFSEILFTKNYSIFDVEAAFKHQQSKLDAKDKEIEQQEAHIKILEERTNRLYDDFCLKVEEIAELKQLLMKFDVKNYEREYNDKAE
ncbi:MAG: hypothetical protein WC901_00885 [Candidatus Margulisiibacteriota bacterium]